MFTGVRPLRNFPPKKRTFIPIFSPPPIEHVLPVGHQRVLYLYHVLYLYEEEEEDEDE
jgi:hypothetical protein